eukprot:scaffold57980_cov16-Tisochrysis_lutea.AAC.3
MRHEAKVVVAIVLSGGCFEEVGHPYRVHDSGCRCEEWLITHTQASAHAAICFTMACLSPSLDMWQGAQGPVDKFVLQDNIQYPKGKRGKRKASARQM